MKHYNNKTVWETQKIIDLTSFKSRNYSIRSIDTLTFWEINEHKTKETKRKKNKQPNIWRVLGAF